MRTESNAYMEQLTNLIISDHELDAIANALNKLMSGTSATSVMLWTKVVKLLPLKEPVQNVMRHHLEPYWLAHSPLLVMLQSYSVKKISALFFSRECMRIFILQ